MQQFFEIRNNANVFVDFGTDDHRKCININSVYHDLGKEGSLGYLFFHAFTGSDSMNSFYRISKSSLFSKWMSYPLKEILTEAFAKLSWTPHKM